MKNLGLVMTIGALVSLAACGENAGVGEEEVQNGQDTVAGQSGELGTVEGSFDVAGENAVNADSETNAQNTGEAR